MGNLGRGRIFSGGSSAPTYNSEITKEHVVGCRGQRMLLSELSNPKYLRPSYKSEREKHFEAIFMFITLGKEEM